MTSLPTMWRRVYADVAPGAPVPPMPDSATEAQRRRAAAARRATAAFGQIVALMLRSRRHQALTVVDLRLRVAPIVAANHYALAGRRFKGGGFARPIAAVLWAEVSPAVDVRLSGDLQGPLMVTREEMSSGDIVWILDALGDPPTVQAILDRLVARRWLGRTVRVRAVTPERTMVVRTLPTS